MQKKPEMAEIYLLVKILFWTFFFLTVLGMLKPWWVLWFLDYKNRLTVLKYYGSLSLLLLVVLILLNQLI